MFANIKTLPISKVSTIYRVPKSTGKGSILIAPGISTFSRATGLIFFDDNEPNMITFVSLGGGSLLFEVIPTGGSDRILIEFIGKHARTGHTILKLAEID